jgi:puromycin-sensitive aminopeptidase
VDIDPYRLPTTITPSNYDLVVAPDIEAGTFRGRVRIDVVVHQVAASIVLNSDELTITEAAVVGPTASQTCEITVDEKLERIELHPPEPLQPGPAVLELAFRGVFNEKLVGLYLSEYTDADGVTQRLATTQFQSTYARKCFPCFDEPAMKASFTVHLEVDDDHLAISNGPEVGRHDLGDGKVRVDFAPTMPMSTYLVAFVVGPLEATEPVDVDGVPLRVVHRPGQAELTPFALEAAAFGLRYFTEYFGLPYPDAKIDLVAIPDFAFGAMENLGCITFREVALLTDPERATKAELQRVADVINHELAHMWFGDLVTMKWWNGLWLNEAFATFMEMRATDAFRPEWDRWTDFALSRSEAFSVDSLSTTRPIEFEVVSPEDADAMFDVLTYEKGAAVVRMLEQYVGEDRFRQGIRTYISNHQFGNAETTDLWDVLEAEVGEPIRRIMDTWIFQGGFPLVTVDSRPGAAPTISQRRMQFAGGEPSEEQTWSVPVRYRLGSDDATTGTDSDAPTEGRILLDGAEPVAIEGADEADWVLVNAGASGFFRTSYDDDRRDDLAAVAVEQLRPAERFALVDDAWAAVLSGQSSAPSFLNLLESLTTEPDRSVWVRMISGYRALKRLVEGEAQERMEEIVHDALSPSLAFLGLSPEADDSDDRRQLRGDLVRGIGVVANDREVQEEAQRTVGVARRNPELVDPALAAAALDVAAHVGDEADFDDFVAAAADAATPQEEIRFLGALCDFPDPDLIARLYTMTLSGEIRPQNSPLLLRRALANPVAAAQTWAFITDNWDELTSMLPVSLVPRMLEGLLYLDRPEQADAAQRFLADHPFPAGERRIDQILERQRIGVALREREAERLRRFVLG